jgi:hypothetical protein
MIRSFVSLSIIKIYDTDLEIERVIEYDYVIDYILIFYSILLAVLSVYMVIFCTFG